MSRSESQRAVTRRYERLARVYDTYTQPMEWMGGARRRRRLLARATGTVLEVGAGTGASLPHYPPDVELVALDIAAGMLTRAHRCAQRGGRAVHLVQADAHRLPFADGAFDTTVATCVFCSVADPVRGLAELARVTNPQGRVLLLEHVRPRNRLLGRLFDWLSPLTRRCFGPAINRRTEANARAAGLELVDVRAEAIWREIAAKPPDAG
jgi:ubiquinone/menaquinone biosynthesis C-methylase UbiE